jgi:membrane protein
LLRESAAPQRGAVNPLGRAEAAWHRAISRSRARSYRFDHVWEARERYMTTFGPRLAAAIAYYGFFAAFAIGLLGYSVLGFVLRGDAAVVRTVDAYLAHNLPFLSPSAIQGARKTVAVAGLVTLVFAGIGWIDGMRSSQRAMWGLDQQPGNFVVRRVIDLAMLLGLGLLLAAALWLTTEIRDLARYLLLWLWPGSAAPGQRLDNAALGWLGEILTVLVNLLMSVGLLLAVPRLWVSPRRMVGPILLLGVGLTVLTTAGRLYVNHTERNPAYQVAGAAVGLLIFLNLFGQLLLFSAALGAAGRRGRVIDLAGGDPAKAVTTLPRPPSD